MFIRRNMMGSGLGALSPPAAVSLAKLLAAGEANAFSFSGIDLSAFVADTGTPANNFDGLAADLFTYSSPSAKYVLNDEGLLVSGTTLRTDHDYAGEPLGLLVEPSRTNGITRSEDFSHAAWTTISTTVSANATTAPNGATTADKIISTAVADTRFAKFQSTGLTLTSPFCVSVFVKSAEWSHALVGIGNSRFTRGIVDLTTGAIALALTGVESANLALTVRRYPNGWWRVCIEGQFSSADSSLLWVGPSEGVEFSDGDGTSGIYAWGAQGEAGSKASSYIPTEASTVTRAADVVGPPLASFPWNAGSGTYTVNGGVETPADNGTLLTLETPTGDTHIESVLWVPA